MLEKYENLIYSKIHRFNINKSQREDYFQEGQSALLESIRKFDPKYKKTFTRFFEMVLVRRFMSLLNKGNKPLYYVEESSLRNFVVKETVNLILTEEKLEEFNEILSGIEFKIFKSLYFDERSITETSNKLGCSEKRIYNAIYRIKNKLRGRIEIS